MHNYGPANYGSLRAYVELDGNGHRTVSAVRRLAAWRMCQRQGTAGS